MPLSKSARLTGTVLLGAIAAAVTGCETTPGPDDPVMLKLNDMDARLTRIERANNGLVDLSQRMDSMQQQIQVLRGRVDELENSSGKLSKQQRDLYSDLDKRLARLEGTAGAGASGAGAAGAGAAGSAASEQAAYAQAINDLKNAQYGTAVGEFQQFLTNYPQSSLADNAQYWMGEAYYVQRDFSSAATAFRTVTERWPKSRKAPDALLKLGYAQYELKHYGDARATLAEVGQRFPGTDAARLASERLRSMENAQAPAGPHPPSPAPQGDSGDSTQ